MAVTKSRFASAVNYDGHRLKLALTNSANRTVINPAIASLRNCDGGQLLEGRSPGTGSQHTAGASAPFITHFCVARITPLYLSPLCRCVSIPAQGLGTIEPCLPSPAKVPPSGPGWLHEIKHDGIRILARRDAAKRAPDYSRSALASNSSTTSWIASFAMSILL